MCSIVSVYVPTHSASQGEGCISDDVLMIVGDFNARMGSGVRGEDNVWDGMQGGNGTGRVNESSEALLSWCALNGPVVVRRTFTSTHGSTLEVRSGTA